MKLFKCKFAFVATMFLLSLSFESNAQCVRHNSDSSAVSLGCKCCSHNEKPESVKIILGSDFGSSTDDLFALMMLHHYIDDGLVDLKGIVVNRMGDKNMGVVDIMNTYYGHPNIPIGLERAGIKNPKTFIPYNGICDLKDKSGKKMFARTQTDPKQCLDGYKLYRKILSEADNNSIVLVEIGFATTLAQLMQSGADEYSSLTGQELVCQKVKAIYIQSGRFQPDDQRCGYNMRMASKDAKIFYDMLPKNVDLNMSPSMVGDNIDYDTEEVLTDLASSEVNPIKVVYQNYKCDTGQRMWDTNCVVQAVKGDDAYNMSERGFVTFVDQGENSLMLFTPDRNGNARFQKAGDSYFNMCKLLEIRTLNRKDK